MDKLEERADVSTCDGLRVALTHSDVDPLMLPAIMGIFDGLLIKSSAELISSLTSALNGNYVRDEIVNGRPIFWSHERQVAIYWDPTMEQWEMGDAAGSYLHSNDWVAKTCPSKVL